MQNSNNDIDGNLEMRINLLVTKLKKELRTSCGCGYVYIQIYAVAMNL